LGVHQAEVKSISGVYTAGGSAWSDAVRAGAEARREFDREMKAAGRHIWSPKIAKDGHDRGQK